MVKKQWDIPRNWLLFLGSSFISGLGTKLTTIGLADKLYKLTGDNFSISLVFLLQSLPMLFLGVMAGTLCDRYNKKGLFVAVNTFYAVTSFLFAVTASPPLLYLILLLTGVLQTLFLPCRIAFLPQIVDPADLMRVNGMRASLNGMIAIFGYGFAGAIVGYLGNTVAFVMDGCSFLSVAFTTLFLQTTAAPNATAVKQSASDQRFSFKTTWNMIRNHPRLQAVLTLEVLTNFIIILQIPLTYIFVARYLGGPARMAQRTGLLFAAAGIGTCLGGLLLNRLRSGNRLLALPKALLFDSLLVLSFALVRFFPLNLILYGLMGVIAAFMGTILETAVQEWTPPEHLGAVSGFIHSIVEPICVVSLLLGGLLTQWLEPSWLFILCAGAELLTGAYFLNRFRAEAGVTSTSEKLGS
ncbi:MFS transporter [Hydrogenispora ethanolica]|uniref:MFS transporter n=1 Tax=Hydrogenispora ethanolica TaxID=1082276 RepID=A0A4R1S6X0_HYDET|nr:MFS transporter [Hydrogenispora ethanolica]TCL75086.1 MFS transporter [Hydrogenispora ethanolica]